MSTRQPDHSTYQEWVHSELDGGLTTGERSQLRDHLAHCSLCRKEKEELLRLERLLADSRLPVRADFCEEVMAALPASGWEAQYPRSWIAALVVVVALAVGAVALISSVGEDLQPAIPLAGAVAAILEMLQSSALAGAGLLTASWKGLGLAFQELIGRSVWNLVALGVLVFVIDFLLLRLLLRRGEPVVERSSRSTSSDKT
jgi:predicted anti-sigma-YlaC factor YlaD